MTIERAHCQWLVACAGLALVACGGGSSSTSEGPSPTDRQGGPVAEPDRGPEEDFERAVLVWDGGAGDAGRVEALLEDAVDQRPSFAEAWFNLGVVRETTGDEQGAIDAYRQSNAADPEFVDGLANIAAIYLGEGRQSEAQQILTQVVEADPFHPGANLNLARLHRARVKRNGTIDTVEADEAINRIRLSLAGDAMNVAAYETLAGVYYDLGRYSLAQLVCNTAIALELESAALYNRFGLILLAMDDVTGAYAQFRHAVAMDGSFTQASMNLGAVALNYRDYQGALTAFEGVLRHDPDNIEARISQGVALRGLDDLAGAEAAYQDVLSRDEGNLAALYNLGVLHQEYHRDYQGAVEWFRRYLRADASRTSDLAADVETRVEILDELIELLGDEASGPPPDPEPDAPAEPVEPTGTEPL